MRKLPVALAFAALLPVAARAEPISLGVESSSGGFTHSGLEVDGLTIDLGTITMPTAGATGEVLIDGLDATRNYTVEFELAKGSAMNTLKLEILDPLDDDDWLDEAQPDYVPAGYSTSNNLDGLSFAQEAGLARSATFAGGSSSVLADEKSHRADILLFSGLNGADQARVTFGLRDQVGGRGFLLRFSAEGLPTPEPASMLLLGTGLVGLAGAYRRRRAS
ncbi:MAG TPA: PEP-CTERM sorting domain-containing protein [Vicinamibacterales bacterium]|nr:PEP-CTERM sorting domain-containing protein [Vicinamibacterales bacterium]